MARKYVPIFFDWTDVTVDLTQEQKGNLIDAIVDYASVNKDCETILSELTVPERIAFRFMKGQVDRNEEISDIRSKARAGVKEQTETKENKKEQTASKADKKEQKETKKFEKPTLEEVREYCKQRGNSVDPEQFINFYASKGWKVGNQPMKDWKACVGTWERRSSGNNQKAVNAQQYQQREYQQEEESPEQMLARLMA